mgnify:CR=1 FL=1
MNKFKKHYNQDSLVYGISPKRKAKIFDLLDNASGKKVLDVGCGEGYLGAEIAKNNNFVVGVDISEKSVGKAKKILHDAMALDLQEEKVPYADKFFDVIVMTEVIEHLLLPEEVFKETKRLLKDDGFMIITTPNFLFFVNRIKILFGQFEYTESGFLDRGHIHFFQIDSFEKMLKQTGLKVDLYNHVYGGRISEFVGRLYPKLFAFQIVAKVSKA